MNQEKIFKYITGLLFVGFIITIFISYNSSMKNDNTTTVVPVITSENSAIREKPADEGGMAIPFRETEIYDSVDINNENELNSSKLKIEVDNSNKPDFKETVDNRKKDINSIINSLETKSEDLIKIEDRQGTTKVSTNPFANYKVQLGSFRQEEDAINAWNRIQKKYPKLLQADGYDIEKATTEKGVFYRTQSKLISKTQAEQLCNLIKNCLIIKAK
jgi:hypothetical protein